MGKYGRLTKQTPPPKRPWAIHPIWQGFGCILLVIGPVTAFAAAHLLVEMDLNHGWFRVPPEMTRPITLPGTIRIFEWSYRIGKDLTISHFYADLMTTVLLLLMVFAFVMIFYSVVYGFLGPRRYGPMDSPPIRLSQKKRRKKVRKGEVE
jgi:hypothetical protein